MRSFFTMLCLLFLTTLSAQRLEHRQGELIVRFTEGADAGAKDWMAARQEIDSWQPLGNAFNAYLVRFDHSLHRESVLRQKYWLDEDIEMVQYNHHVSMRERPDDTFYNDHWHHLNVGQQGGVAGADHNIESAWDVTTGGVTANGDTIVVAILDDGADLDHDDLRANLWKNLGEIPNNGIDDDGNGYVDDFYGYDTSSNDGDPDAGPVNNHGTSVMGIVGAVGNNNLGSVGINWKVKLMSVRNGFLTSESEVLEAYSYALEARQRYNESDGVSGAYVVATNASWGRDFGNVEDSPIWCGLYDELGEAGIINAGATINRNTNVDEEGDLPTNCPSEFLVGVTNMNINDEKVTAAGFGSVSIDLGAYGEGVFATANGSAYHAFGGTSAATPMVAGAMALLYAAPCATFAELLIADPSAAALYIREIVLSTTAPNTDLAGITVTGGKLDVGAAMAELMSRCNDCLTPTSFTASPTPEDASSITVNWRAIASLNDLTLRYRAIGTTDWISVSNPTAPYLIENLPACSGYEVQLEGMCTDQSVETGIISTATDGCCEIPEDFSVAAFPNQLFLVSWTELLAADFYRIRYRQQGDDAWQTRTAMNTPIGIGGLEPCTVYEFEFQADCDTFATDFGSRMTVISTGCGACNEEDYCIPDDFDSSEEHIAEVSFGGLFRKPSAASPEGYISYGELTEEAFVQGGVYRLRMTPDVGGQIEEEGWKVYIDWNQDGVFASSEAVAELDNPDGEPAVADITVPNDAALGLTRMRVMMQFQGVRGNACGSSALGEVEDYCINIGEAQGCPPPASVNATFVDDIDETLLSWSASAAAGGDYRLRYRLRGSSDAWVEMDVSVPEAIIRPLNLCASYELEIASICNGEPGDYKLFLFNDDCTDTPDRRLETAEWSVFPNPAYTTTRARWSGDLRAESLRLFDATGQMLRELPAGANYTDVDVADLDPGVYLLELRLADGRAGLRKVVVR
jgi:hypothetical protein